MRIKKFGALATGALMLGATLAGVPIYAQNEDVMIVPEIPPKSFFVDPETGEIQAKVVVGEKAAASDVVGAANIAAKLGNMAFVVKKAPVEIKKGTITGIKARLTYELETEDYWYAYYVESGPYVLRHDAEFVTPAGTTPLPDPNKLYDVFDDNYWPYIVSPYESEFKMVVQAKNRVIVRDVLTCSPCDIAPRYMRRSTIDFFGSGWDLSLLQGKVYIGGYITRDVGAGPEDWELKIPRAEFEMRGPTAEEVMEGTVDAGGSHGMTTGEVICPTVKGIVHVFDFTDESEEVYGALEGDEIDMLGSSYMVVDIDEEDEEVWIAKLGSEGYVWLKTGGEYTVNGYTIKLIDVNLFEQKAVIQLFKVGETTPLAEETIGYRVDPKDPSKNVMFIYKDGEIVVKFGTALVGAEGIVEAKLIIGHDAVKLRENRSFPWDPDYNTNLLFEYDEVEEEWALGEIVFYNNVVFDDTTEVFGPNEAWMLYYEYDEITKERAHYEKGRVVFHVERTETVEKAAGERFDLPFEGQPSAKITVEDVEVAGMTIVIGGEEVQVGQEMEFATRVPIPEDLAILDSDVEANPDYYNYNLILVGGPAVNNEVKKLQDQGKLTTDIAGLRADQGVIEWVEDPWGTEKDALVVAGGGREGTAKAVKKLLEELDAMME